MTGSHLPTMMFEWLWHETVRCLGIDAVRPWAGSLAGEPKCKAMRFEVYTLGNRLQVELRKLDERGVDGEVRSIPLTDRELDAELLQSKNWPKILDADTYLKILVNFLRYSTYHDKITDLVIVPSPTRPMAIFETPAGWMKLSVEPYIL